MYSSTLNVAGAITLSFLSLMLTGCKADSTEPLASGTVEVSFARMPEVQLAVLDTITVMAIVRDANGHAVHDAVVTWELKPGFRSPAYEKLGSIKSLGPSTALLTLQAETETVIVASIPSSGETGKISGQLDVTVAPRRFRAFQWSRESGFAEIAAPPGVHLEPYAVNDAGEILGAAISAADTRTFKWTPSLGFRYVEFASLHLQGRAMNGSGGITGYVSNNFSSQEAFVWSPSLSLYTFGPLAGNARTYSLGVSINSYDAISGRITDDTLFTAFRWSEERGMELLRGHDGVPNTDAVAINDAFEVLGYDGVWEGWDPFLSQRVPVLWGPNGELTDILPDCNRPCNASVAGLNNRGEVAGSRDNVAFRWSRSSGIKTIPLAGVTWATAMNDAGDIVVATRRSGIEFERASLWAANGEVFDIGLPPAAEAIYPVAINNKGVIVGTFR
jgi:hypothetical protein